MANQVLQVSNLELILFVTLMTQYSLVSKVSTQGSMSLVSNHLKYRQSSMIT